jgi:hypothetical protein
VGNASVMKHIDIRTAYKSKLRLINIISYDSIGKAINNYVVVSQVSYVLIKSYVAFIDHHAFMPFCSKSLMMECAKNIRQTCSYIRNNAAY